MNDLYIKFYRSDLSEHFDFGEHVGVLSSIKFFSANFGGIVMIFFALVST